MEDNNLVMARIPFMPSLDSIKSVCTLQPLPDYGDTMTLNKFAQAVEEDFFMDYDGHGKLVCDDRLVANSIVNCQRRIVEIKGEFIFSLWALFKEYPLNFKIIWFNK